MSEIWKSLWEKLRFWDRNCLESWKMEKVKRFLKVIPPTDDSNNRARQQVYNQVHPQVGRRRRKSRAKRDGWVRQFGSEEFSLKLLPFSRRHSRSDGRLTGPGSIVSVNPSVQMPEVPIGQPETLRQKAFAKLRLFNLNLNWDLHQCKCVLGWFDTDKKYSRELSFLLRRPRSLLSRRLHRGRKFDDNELYRSNSFRFQRFERNGDDRRSGRQVSSTDL